MLIQTNLRGRKFVELLLSSLYREISNSVLNDIIPMDIELVNLFLYLIEYSRMLLKRRISLNYTDLNE